MCPLGSDDMKIEEHFNKHNETMSSIAQNLH